MQPLKYAALTLFVLQNAGVILLMRYSKVESPSGTGYSTASVVLLQECTKLPVCLVLYAIELGGLAAMVRAVGTSLRERGAEWLQLSIPALLYTVQNWCLFLGLANLEAVR